MATNVVGPSQSYAAQIPQAKRDAKNADGTPAPNLGVGDDGNFGQMATNMKAGFTQVNQLIDGPPLGNRQFVNTGGQCINTQGKLVSRQNYINNLPDRGALGGVAGSIFGDGLISGMITDMEGMIPTQLMKGMTAPPTPACDLQECPVTDVLVEPPDAAAQQSPDSRDRKYLSAGLTPDLERSLGKAGCKKVALAPASDALAEQKVQVDALQAEQTRLTEEVSKNPENTALKTALSNVTDQLEAAQADYSAMDKRSKAQNASTNPDGREEAFTLMSSPATGGLLVAGILLAYLVFSKRR